MKQYIAILMILSMLCSSLLSAQAQELNNSVECLSPALSVTIENFQLNFSAQMIINDKTAMGLLSRIRQEINSRSLIGDIERFYNGALDELVNGDVNRAWRNLSKALAICDELMGVFHELQLGGVILDKGSEEFFQRIDEYEIRISDCFDDISRGQAGRYKEAWKIQRVDPATGDFLPQGVLRKEDLENNIASERIVEIMRELDAEGIINLNADNGTIVSEALDKIFEAEQLQISANQEDKIKVLKVLRDCAQGVPSNFFEAHKKGIWHATVQVLIVDSAGHILVEHRSDKIVKLITKDLAASGHLIHGESYPQAVKRIIGNNLGIAVTPEHLYEVAELPYGQRKMGRSDFNGKIYYDDSRIMHVSSRDTVNNEYSKCFIYLLDDTETVEIKNKQIDGKLMGEFMPIPAIFSRMDTFDPAMYRSSFMRIFNNPDNFEHIIEHMHDILIGILRDTINNPENNQYNVQLISEFAGEIISMRNDFSESKKQKLQTDDEYMLNRGKAGALREFSYVSSMAKVVYRWQQLKTLLIALERDSFLNLSDVRKFFKGLKILGLDDQDGVSRALIYLLLRKDVNLIWDEGQKCFLFKHSDGVLQGMRIELDGMFRITNKKIIKNIKEIQRGVVASDMDLVLAMRDKNIDKEILKFFNQMRIIGFAVAIISGNEFRKQYGRSLAELIHENLLRDFYIYANGAGVKAKWARRKIGINNRGKQVMGDFEGDKKYIAYFSPQQLSFFNTRIQPVLRTWEIVIETIRNHRELLDDKNKHDDLKTIILSQLAQSAIETKLAENMDGIIEDFYEVLYSENNNDEKFKLYQSKVRAQLDPQRSKESLKQEKNWPYLDSRPSFDGKNLIQLTLKPIYPANKYLISNRSSAREIVGKIVAELLSESNAQLFPDMSDWGEYAPLGMKEGGDSSVDITRKDVDKAKAANDLIKSLNLQDALDLLLAFDDELASYAVGFAFLKVKGITFISMEKTKDGKKREYSADDKAKIKAFMLWSQECGIGTEIEATKNIFQKLLDICEDEMWTMLTGKNKNPGPAIRRFKKELFKNTLAALLVQQAQEVSIGVFPQVVPVGAGIDVSI